MAVEITPAQIEAAVIEVLELRKEYQNSIRKMQYISVEERFT